MKKKNSVRNLQDGPKTRLIRGIYCGPKTRLEERLARGDEGINRLDQVCKQHNINYSNALSLSDKHSADQKMTDAIEQFPNQSLTERAIKNTIKLKKNLDSVFQKDGKSRRVRKKTGNNN